MKRFLIAFGLILATALMVYSQRGPRGGFRGGYGTESLPQASSESEKKVLSVLAEAQKAGDLFLNVPVTDGRMLRLLTEASSAKNVVEIGTSTGLSGLWLCLALSKTGGKLTTFEYDTGRAATARRHFKEAGVDSIATIVEGDAHQTIARLKDPIDVLFIDADKEGYTDVLEQALLLLLFRMHPAFRGAVGTPRPTFKRADDLGDRPSPTPPGGSCHALARRRRGQSRSSACYGIELRISRSWLANCLTLAGVGAV